MKAVVPGMRERDRGWILNLTSFAAELPPGPPFPTDALAGCRVDQNQVTRVTIDLGLPFGLGVIFSYAVETFRPHRPAANSLVKGR